MTMDERYARLKDHSDAERANRMERLSRRRQAARRAKERARYRAGRRRVRSQLRRGDALIG